MDTIKVIGSPLYQWEIGRKIQIIPPPNTRVDRVEFSHKGDAEALCVAITEENGVMEANIPNIILQSSERVLVYLVCTPDGCMETTTFCVLPVISRPKPSDYVYTETEVLTWRSIDSRVKALEEKVEGGNGSGVTDAEKALILSLFKNAAYTADMSATFAQLEELWGGSGDNPGEGGGDEPVEPDEPDIPVEPDEPEEPHTHSYTSSVTTAATCDTAGVRTYNCTCGHSYTEAIQPTGHNYVDGTCTNCGAADPDYDAGGEDETEQTEAVYTLAQATTFNRDQVLDTGYKLLNVDKSWSVCIDHNDAARGGTVWDASPNASQGLALTHRGGYHRTLMVAGSLYRDVGTVVGNYKVIATHTKNTDVVNYHYVLPGTTNLVSGEITYTKYLTDSNIISPGPRTVKLGGRYDGTTADYKGTINRFEIYERVLSEAEIYAFTGAEVPEGVTDYVTVPCTVPTDNIVAGYINDAGAVAELEHAYLADTYIKVTAGNSYLVDATELFAVQEYDTYCKYSWWDSNGVFVSRGDSKFIKGTVTVTITAPDNAEYLKVGLSGNTTTAETASEYIGYISISEVE